MLQTRRSQPWPSLSVSVTVSLFVCSSLAADYLDGVAWLHVVLVIYMYSSMNECQLWLCLMRSCLLVILNCTELNCVALYYSVLYSTVRRLLLCCAVLCSAAGYRMEYDENELKGVVEDGVPDPSKEEGEFLIKPTFIAMKEEVTMLRPFEFVFGKFEYGMSANDKRGWVGGG